MPKRNTEKANRSVIFVQDVKSIASREMDQAGPPSLMMLCCDVLAKHAHGIENLDYIPDELVLAICERAPGVQLAHVERVIAEDEYRSDVFKSNMSNWHNHCRQRWGHRLQELCRRCCYARDDKYWKLIFLTASMQDALENLTECTGYADSLAELIDVTRELITSLSLRRATRTTVQLVSQHFHRLESLDLTGCALVGQNDARAVGNLMLACPSLLSANLSKNALGKEDGIIAIAVAVSKHQTLVFLNISWNSVSDRGAKALVQALQRNASVAVLDARWNDIGLEGRRALMALGKTRSTALRIQLY